ncbi:MAG: FtsQ-type POTRA domain-containing protein [Oscillospiraceae bacterium]|nr:FtsQ-type POTRA domain-containing protein [Oscillospiraceae bacterium]
MPQKRNPNRRRRRRGGLGRLLRPLSLLLTAVAVVAALTLFFKVEEIEVVGAVRYQAEDIISASGVEPGDNLILLNRYQVSQRIYTNLPYITDVRPKPKFPGTLVIEVTETRPVAAIEGGGAWWLVNSEGKVLDMLDAVTAADYLPVLGVQAEEPAVSGHLKLPEDSPMTAGRLCELLGAMEERSMISRADSVDLTDPKTLILNYDGRFRVEMYYDANLSFKIDSLLWVVADYLEPNETGTIRMTMSDDNQVNFIPKSSE